MTASVFDRRAIPAGARVNNGSLPTAGRCAPSPGPPTMPPRAAASCSRAGAAISSRNISRRSTIAWPGLDDHLVRLARAGRIGSTDRRRELRAHRELRPVRRRSARLPCRLGGGDAGAARRDGAFDGRPPGAARARRGRDRARGGGAGRADARVQERVRAVLGARRADPGWGRRFVAPGLEGQTRSPTPPRRARRC